MRLYINLSSFACVYSTDSMCVSEWFCVYVCACVCFWFTFSEVASLGAFSLPFLICLLANFMGNNLGALIQACMPQSVWPVRGLCKLFLDWVTFLAFKVVSGTLLFLILVFHKSVLQKLYSVQNKLLCYSMPNCCCGRLPSTTRQTFHVHWTLPKRHLLVLHGHRRPSPSIWRHSSFCSWTHQTDLYDNQLDCWPDIQVENVVVEARICGVAS